MNENVFLYFFNVYIFIDDLSKSGIFDLVNLGKMKVCVRFIVFVVEVVFNF